MSKGRIDKNEQRKPLAGVSIASEYETMIAGMSNEVRSRFLRNATGFLEDEGATKAEIVKWKMRLAAEFVRIPADPPKAGE